MERIQFTYEEKHHIIEVDGVDYEIPQRTAELEEKIRELNEKASEMSEYEGGMAMLEIFFGEESAHKMFPHKEKTNLDKLAKCTKMVVAAYMAEYNNIQNEEFKEKMAEIEPLLDQISNVGRLTESALQAARSKRRPGKATTKKK